MNGANPDPIAKRAEDFHAKGFNCAQSVACSCADAAGIDAETAFKLTEGLGGGIGRFTETCGALLGGAAILGYATSVGPDDPTTKRLTYEKTRQLADQFEASIGSTLCKEIKDRAGNPPLRSCDECIAEGARLTLDLLTIAEPNPH